MGLSNFFSSLFGKAKEKAEIAKENLSEVAENVAEKAADVAEDVKETVENVAEKVSDKLEEMGVPEKVNEFVDVAKEKTAEAAGWVEEKAHNLKESLQNAAETVEDKVEDLTGHGVEDLQKGILRTPLDPVVTFLQDPLRILRAIRFAAKYGFELDDTLIQAARNSRVQKTFLDKLAHERIWKEMVGVQETEGFKRGFLTGPDPARAARLMNVLGIRDLLFTLSDEEKKMLGVKQDETAHWDADQNTPHHNLNIWEHTLEAMKHLANIAKDSKIDEGKENGEVEEAIRHLSILLHDIGKCDLCSRQTKEDGTFSYLGHAESSAKIAEHILDKKFKAPKDITQRVRNIIYNHMRLHVLEDHPSDSALRRVMKEMGDDWQNLVYHSIADAMGKLGAIEDPKYRALIPRFIKSV